MALCRTLHASVAISHFKGLLQRTRAVPNKSVQAALGNPTRMSHVRAAMAAESCAIVGVGAFAPRSGR
jgi:hypothetical protein